MAASLSSSRKSCFGNCGFPIRCSPAQTFGATPYCFFTILTIYVAGLASMPAVGSDWADVARHSGFSCCSASMRFGSRIFLATLCARFRDIQQMVVTLLQISLFLTPIFWSPDQLTGRTAMLAQLNPTVSSRLRSFAIRCWARRRSCRTGCVVILITVVGWALTIQMLTKFRQRIVYWL